MKNIIKSLIVMFSSISLFASANAGELSVSGTAKATYNIQSGKTNAGKGLGITNELNFTASGELDNGYTWSYSMEVDPGENSTTNQSDLNNDDSKMTLSTPMGTVGVFISEGGLDVEDAASQSAYARPTDMGDPSGTSDNYTIDAYNNIQYHTPADLLPFGVSAKIAYATDLGGAAGASGNKAGSVQQNTDTTVGTNATEYQVKASPIDGLTIGASYLEFGGQSGEQKNDQNAESGAYYATYATGPVSIGYSKAHKATHLIDNHDGAGTGTTGAVEDYDQTNYSIAFAATDDLSVSYERETSEANKLDDTSVEQESSSVQVAYTMGGMTLAVAHSSHDNNGYVTGANTDQTLLAVTMAF
jgi:outer membrane protein OmpU